MSYKTAMALRIVSAVTCGSIIGAGIHSAIGVEPRADGNALTTDKPVTAR